MAEALSYCGQLAREYDPDRFLLSMFAPASRRADLWALLAFNHEIAKTREVVSETQLGLIRLQWWRERIGEVYEGAEAPEHEVLQPLAAAIQAHDLPQEEFDALVYAREFDLEDVLPASVEGLVNYADFTNAPLLRLALRVLGEDPDAEPVNAVAVNYGLIGVLRAVPYYARQRRCLLPADLMEQAGQRLDHLYEGKLVNGFSSIIKEIAGHVECGVRPGSRFLKGSQALAEMHLKQLKRLNYNPFHPRMIAPPAFKEVRLIIGAVL